MVTRQTYRLDMNPFKCQNCQGTSNFLFTCCIQHSGDIYMAITCTAVGRRREKSWREMSQRATYGRCYKGGHSGSRETECAAVLHPPKRRETGVEQREVCKEGDRERERGVGRGVYRVGNIEKCRQPNLLDIYNGQTGQLVTANLPTCNAAQAHRTKSQKELEAHAAPPLPPPQLPLTLQLNVMRMWDYLRCLRQAATNGSYQLRQACERGVKGDEREKGKGSKGRGESSGVEATNKLRGTCAILSVYRYLFLLFFMLNDFLSGVCS